VSIPKEIGDKYKLGAFVANVRSNDKSLY
jgi:hypothetical protein